MPGKRVIIFDLDGVITSERVYWDTAASAISRIAGAQASLPIELIAEVKARAVNSNWDLAYVVLCCRALASTREPSSAELIGVLDAANGETGAAFLKAIGRAAGCEHGGSEWQSVHDLCQQLHDEKFQKAEAGSLEHPIVDHAALKDTLQRLVSGWDAELGVATGRPRIEAERALSQFGILPLFTPARMVYYDDIIAAESALGRPGLTKPHPYSVLRAAFPSALPDELIDWSRGDLPWVAYVGDGMGDMLAAKAAGVTPIGVLTGIPDIKDFRSRRCRDLESAGSAAVAASILEVPGALNSLNHWRM